MQATWEEKAEKGSMTIQVKITSREGMCSRIINCFLIMLVTFVGYNSCSPDLSDDPIPWVPFASITINLNLPQYQNLRTDGGWTYLNDGGVRGLIIYRQTITDYIVYERNCSYQPNNACATVDVHTSNLYMVDPCCNSSFDFRSGLPTGGPAWRPLQKYKTLLSGSDLTITDEVVE